MVISHWWWWLTECLHNPFLESNALLYQPNFLQLTHHATSKNFPLNRSIIPICCRISPTNQTAHSTWKSNNHSADWRRAATPHPSQRMSLFCTTPRFYSKAGQEPANQGTASLSHEIVLQQWDSTLLRSVCVFSKKKEKEHIVRCI